MTLKNEEMLSKYFERKMTSSEEQNFLISVAANDELRLAFRSQLELMRAVSHDKDGIRSAAEVRSRTLAAIGLSALAADSFLEYDLLSRQAKEEVTETSASAPAVQQAGSASGIVNFFRKPFMTVAAGLTAGFIGAMVIFSGPSEEKIQVEPSTVTAPQSTGSTNTPQTLQNEQIEAQSSPSTPAVQAPAIEPVRRSVTRAERKPVVETNTPETGLLNKANSSQESPVVIDRQNAGQIGINTKISKPGDSAKKENPSKE